MISQVQKLVFMGKESKMLKVTFSNGIESCVPKDEANKDYQNILAWVAEGNTIQEAD